MESLTPCIESSHIALLAMKYDIGRHIAGHTAEKIIRVLLLNFTLLLRCSLEILDVQWLAETW